MRSMCSSLARTVPSMSEVSSRGMYATITSTPAKQGPADLVSRVIQRILSSGLFRPGVEGLGFRLKRQTVAERRLDILAVRIAQPVYRPGAEAQVCSSFLQVIP